MDGEKLSFYGVKIMAILTTGLLYFIVLSAFSMAIDSLFDPAAIATETTQRSISIVLLQVGMLILSFYAARTQLKKVSSFYNGLAGFDSSRLSENSGTVISAVGLLMFSGNFIGRINKVKPIIRDYFAGLLKQ